MLQWIREAKYYYTSFFEYDKCGNRFESVIYSKDGKLYEVNFCEKHPCEVWSGEGYIRDYYEPIEVTEEIKEVVIEERTYTPVKKEV